MPSILYVDNPSLESRAQVAQALHDLLQAQIVTVSSVEEFSAHMAATPFDLYVCGDSMLHLGQIVQGWGSLKAAIMERGPAHLSKLIVLSGRQGVIEGAHRQGIAAFHRQDGFEEFLAHAQEMLTRVKPVR